jgi:2-amino-4-hydroxy-6-hydroxymethyldihydropteridine diphosphokinase
MNTVIIGVGSNIEAKRHVEQAKDLLFKEQHFLKESTFIPTSPIGFTNQPDFLNGAFLIETEMDKEEFLVYLKNIENRLGRVRAGDKNGPRTIDLDIVVWNGEIVCNDYYERDFVKNAVAELMPYLGPKINGAR